MVKFKWGIVIINIILQNCEIMGLKIKNKLGIEFGDAKVRNWTISLVISFLMSIFITLPIQVNMI